MSIKGADINTLSASSKKIQMPIENIPKIYIKDKKGSLDLFVYDFKMTSDVVKSKVNLGMNMFSFLQVGKKQVHFAGISVAVNKDQSLLLKKGNCVLAKADKFVNTFSLKRLKACWVLPEDI